MEDYSRLLEALKEELKTDIFEVTNKENPANLTPQFVTKGLGVLKNYLDFLSGNVEDDQEPDEYRAALKTANKIIIDNTVVWDREKHANTGVDFQTICAKFEENTELKWLYGLNRNAARTANALIGDIYKFKKNVIKNLNEIFSNNEYCFVFDYPPESNSKLVFERNGNVFKYQLTTESASCTDGVRFYKLDGSTSALIETNNPIKGETLCKIDVIATVDLTNYPTAAPVTRLRVTVQSNLIEYYGPLGPDVPEIIQIETTKIRNTDLSIERQILDFQAVSLKIGMLIHNILESRSNQTRQLFCIVQLYQFVITDALLHLNNLATYYINDSDIDRDVFLNGLNLRFFIVDPSKLPITLNKAFKYIFSSLDDIQILELNEIFQSALVSDILESSILIKNDPNQFLSKYGSNIKLSIDIDYLSAVNHIITKAIETTRQCLQVELALRFKPETNQKRRTSQNEAIKDRFYQNYLFGILQGTLAENPFKTEINPKQVYDFLLNSSNAENDFTTEQTVLNLLGSNIRIGSLIEKLLISFPNTIKQAELSILFVMSAEFHVSQFAKQKLLDEKSQNSDQRIGPASDEIIDVINQLNDFQIAKFLRIFHPRFRSGTTFQEIESAAKAISTSDSGHAKQLAEYFYCVIEAMNAALDAIIILKNIINLGPVKKITPEEHIETQTSVTNILSEYIQSNIFNDYLYKLPGLINFFKERYREKNTLRKQEKEDNETQENDKDVIVVLHANIPKKRKRLECFTHHNLEAQTELTIRNPLTQAAKAIGVSLFIDQVSRLFRVQNENTSEILDYLKTSLVIIAATLLVTIGYRRILNPTKIMNRFERVFVALTDGLIVNEFTLAIVINFVLFFNPKDKEVSDDTFALMFFAYGPAFALVFYTFWHSMTPYVKETWFPQNSKRQFVENWLIDFPLDTLYTCGVLSTASLQIANVRAGNLVGGVAIPLALSLPFAAMYKTKYKTTARASITYAVDAIFATVKIRDWVYNKNQIPDYILMAYFVGVTGVSIYTMARHLTSFHTRYIGDPELQFRKLKASELRKAMANTEGYSASTSLRVISQRDIDDYTSAYTQHVKSNTALEEQPLLENLRSEASKPLLFSGKKADKAPENKTPSRQWCAIV